MSNEAEKAEAQLAEDRQGLELVAAYENDLPQDVILKLAKSSQSAAHFAEKLEDAKREIDVKAAVDLAGEAAEKRFAEMADDMGLNDRPRYEKPEPEEEPDPEGHWTASEGDSWDVVAEHFNDGSMSMAAYVAEREARGMEALY